MSTKELLKMVGAFVVALTVLISMQHEAQANHPDDLDNKIPSVNLALSGGGLRASAFSYGVMLGLERFCVENKEGVQTLVYKELPPRDMKPEKLSPCPHGQSLLDKLHILSAVSGGAITAGYYQTHTKEEFLEQYGDKLRTFNFPMNLVLHADTSLKSFSLNRYLRAPAHLVTSIIDIFTTFALSPLRLFTSFDVELTPFATMTLSDGLLESARLVNVYNDNFFESATFQQINAKDTHQSFIKTDKPASLKSKPELLINATDIRNGRVFTFDQDTFECLGASSAYRDMPIAVAAAAASSLPGVFTPINLEQYLNGNTPDRIPSNCPDILGDTVRSPVLVDGGVSDNLGVLGLLGRIFAEKNQRSDNSNPKEKRAFIIAVNAAVNSDSTLPGMAKQLDGSFDVLMRDKTAISSEMASGLMRNFGLGTVIISYSDLVHNNEIVRMIASDLYGRTKRDALGESTFQDEMSRTPRYTEMEQKVLEDLNHISMLPSKAQIDTLIAAGRAAVAERHKEIRAIYKRLTEKSFTSSCPRVVNPDQEYCWPKEFELPHLMSNSTGEIVHQISRVSEHFAQSTIETRKQYVDFLKQFTRSHGNAIGAHKKWGETYRLIYPVRITEDQCLPLLLSQNHTDCQLSEALNNGLSPIALLLWQTIQKVPSEFYEKDLIRRNEMPAAKNEQAIRNGLQSLRDCRRCPETPWYYVALSRLYRNLSEGEMTIQTLEEGLSRFPGDMNLLHDLGIALINAKDRHDYSGGLHYLRLAREVAKSTQIRLMLLGSMEQSSEALQKEQFRQQQLKRFKNAELKFALDIAFYASVASHLPPGKAQYISDAEVLLWLQEHYQWDGAKQKISAGNTQKTEKTETSVAETFLIDKLASELGKAYTLNNQTQIDVLEGYLIQEARAFMAEKSYMNDAVKFARDVYTTQMQESLPLDYLKATNQQSHDTRPNIQDTLPMHEVLDIYGFTILMSDAEQSCPQRQPSVAQAQALFKKALAKLDEAGNINAPGFSEQLWNERIRMHQEASQKLSCSAF